MATLKQCPFCGNNKAAMYRNYSSGYRKYFVWVECDVCGAKTKAAMSYSDPAGDDDWDNAACGKARAAWNLRAGDPDGE